MSTRATRREAMLYGLIGMSGVLIDILLFVLLHEAADVDKQVANVASISIAIANNFVWNARYTFNVRDRLIRRFAAFYLVGLVGIGITAAMLVLCVDGLGWSPTITKCASLPVVFVVQFVLNKHVSFGGARAPSIGGTT